MNVFKTVYRWAIGTAVGALGVFLSALGITFLLVESAYAEQLDQQVWCLTEQQMAELEQRHQDVAQDAYQQGYIEGVNDVAAALDEMCQTGASKSYGDYVIMCVPTGE